MNNFLFECLPVSTRGVRPRTDSLSLRLVRFLGSSPSSEDEDESSESSGGGVPFRSVLSSSLLIGRLLQSNSKGLLPSFSHQFRYIPHSTGHRLIDISKNKPRKAKKHCLLHVPKFTRSHVRTLTSLSSIPRFFVASLKPLFIDINSTFLNTALTPIITDPNRRAQWHRHALYPNSLTIPKRNYTPPAKKFATTTGFPFDDP